jgi:hypothetical protein
MPQSPVRRPAAVSRPPHSSRNSAPAGGRRTGRGRPPGKPGGKADHEILFQQYFKSANPQKTYAAQLKRAGNGNHYLILTEGKRDESSGEVRKTRVFVYSEDFKELFKMLQAAALFIRANPVPDEVKRKRERFWQKQAQEPAGQSKQGPVASPAATPVQTA